MSEFVFDESPPKTRSTNFSRSLSTPPNIHKNAVFEGREVKNLFWKTTILKSEYFLFQVFFVLVIEKKMDKISFQEEVSKAKK